jgi:DNA-binding transcriptional MerR regulator
MTIGELADRAGIRPSRIRYYESVGVLPPPRRQSGARRYDVSAVETLRSVLAAQRLGLSLAEIRAVASGERNFADVAMEHARAGRDDSPRARSAGAAAPCGPHDAALR